MPCCRDWDLCSATLHPPNRLKVSSIWWRGAWGQRKPKNLLLPTSQELGVQRLGFESQDVGKKKGVQPPPCLSPRPPRTSTPLQNPEGVNISPATHSFHLEAGKRQVPGAQPPHGPRWGQGEAWAPGSPSSPAQLPPRPHLPQHVARPPPDPDALISPQTAKHR